MTVTDELEQPASEDAARPTRKERHAAKQAEAQAQAQRRVMAARERMRRAAQVDDRCLVALSGGKDSLITLDLACQTFKHVEAFYLYLVRGLTTFEAPVDAAARRHNITVHKMPHFDLARLIKYAVLRPHVPQAAQIKEMRWADINEAMRKQTGIHWIAAGERASDSIQRRFYTRQQDGVQPKLGRIFPIYDWLDADVYGYLRVRGISIPSYGAYSRQRGSGFSLDGRGLAWLKEANPADYRRVLKVFPYAEAEVMRWHRRAAAEAANPTARKRRRRATQESDGEEDQTGDRDAANSGSGGAGQEDYQAPEAHQG